MMCGASLTFDPAYYATLDAEAIAAYHASLGSRPDYDYIPR